VAIFAQKTAVFLRQKRKIQSAFAVDTGLKVDFVAQKMSKSNAKKPKRKKHVAIAFF
jgi:hypothetical protein